MSDQLSAKPPSEAEGAGFHNSVLIRTHEPRRAGGNPWLTRAPLVVALVAGVAFWAYLSAHPAAPIVNHAVGAQTP
ncbi:MAG TPA: hypothetical protein VHW60_21715 [Caulobacteraceae bacterium]|jgi:hypothetical protein|nr:hypothetical protein [Caulobacteraceae bacterium]